MKIYSLTGRTIALWSRTRFKKKAYVKANISLQKDLAEMEHWGLYLDTGILALRGCTGENRNDWDWCMCYKF